MALGNKVIWLTIVLALLCSGVLSEELLVRKKDGAEILAYRVKDNNKEFIRCDGKKIPINQGDTVQETDKKCQKNPQPRPPRPYPTPEAYPKPTPIAEHRHDSGLGIS